MDVDLLTVLNELLPRCDKDMFCNLIKQINNPKTHMKTMDEVYKIYDDMTMVKN